MIKQNIFETDTLTGKISKKDIKIKFIGKCDLLTSELMYLYYSIKEDYLLEIVSNLQYIMSISMGLVVNESEVNNLLRDLMHHIAELEENYHFKGLILLGSTKKSALVHVVRAVCRETEINYIDSLNDDLENLSNIEINIYQYFNKLSTYLYDLALKYEKN